MALLDHALRYAARGWPVFPLAPRSKKPLKGTRGFLEATTDADQIRAWWDLHPDANIGVATGRAMGIFVIDIDGARGSASLTELEEEIGPLPDTLDGQTGGGGRHLFFEWPVGREIRNKQNLRPGIDVRGEGGYCLIPPSVHPNGREYAWTTNDKGLVARAPQEWLELLVPAKRPRPPWERVAPPPRRPPPNTGSALLIVDRARLYLAECAPAVQGSGGHDALLWAARALVVGFELDDATALSLLWSDYNPRCRPQWDESDERDRRDFERKVGQARRTPSKKSPGWLLDELGLRDSMEALTQIARGQQSTAFLLAKVAAKVAKDPAPIPLEERVAEVASVDRRPFPVDLFPEPIAAFCHAVAESHSVDMSFAALPVLAVAGAAMGNAWRLELKRGFRVPPILWVGLVSPSGTNKSGPLKDVVAPLRSAVQADQILEAMLNPQGRMVVSDATLEAVVARLQDSKRGLLVFRDELAGWAKGFNAYKKGGGDEQAWLEFWGGNEYNVDRKTDDQQISIPSAACSILGGIQPSVLSECFDPARFASGLVPRILIACPPETDMFWSEAEVGIEAETRWESAVYWLRTRPFLGLDSNRGRFVPRVVSLTPEAKAAYVSFFNVLSLERAEVGEEHCKSIISKARVQAGRLALIHHGLRLACEDASDLDRPLSLGSMEAAIAWARWCLEEQIRVFKFGGLHHKQERARYLIERIKERLPTRTATATQIHRLNSRRFKSASAARAAMAQLVELGHAQWASGKKRKIVLVDGAQERA